MANNPDGDAIRVLIVDDHSMVRRGLRSLLSAYPDIRIVGEAGDGMAALQSAVDLSPDVILLDIRMPGPDGVEIAYQLCRKAINSKVIVLSAYDDESYVQGALQAGAFAYLLKNSSDETVVETIRLVHQGKHSLSPSLIDQVLRNFKSLAQAHTSRESGLSEEELRALGLIANGATNEEIAKEMYWSERTTKRQVEEILSKLGARNRAQAVAEAVKRGLI